MTNNFDDVMSQKTDSELLKIVTSPAGDYQESALEAAKKEFSKRNLSDEQVSSVKLEIEQDRKVQEEKANIPLGTGWKILTAIFPGILQIIFSGTFKADGYDRKAKELVQWTLYGFGFYGGIVFLIIVLEFVF